MYLPDSYLDFFVVTNEFSIFLLAENSIMPRNCSAPGCRSNYDKDIKYLLKLKQNLSKI